MPAKLGLKQLQQVGATTGQTITWNGTAWVPVSNSGAGTLTPAWVKVTKAYSDFSTAATTNSPVGYVLGAAGVIHAVKIRHTTAFSGTGITAYTISVGVSGNLAKYASAFDVFQTVSDTAYQLSNALGGEGHTTTTNNILFTATSTGANLNAASGAGTVEIWLLVSQAV